ncbi:hypothetical protein BV22DRAFT_286100 [Leucogyrophana mollusca]|uniref:Uncharacterized protein n=1 Tax=Leucogyrophana mollusca TaxID=85980 RepID=A0ACB8BRD6_9AGAM|nr:hypothetical protein BV22DRAFT_286100 [Leucogyrophana mollusca]
MLQHNSTQATGFVRWVGTVNLPFISLTSCSNESVLDICSWYIQMRECVSVTARTRRK